MGFSHVDIVLPLGNRWGVPAGSLLGARSDAVGGKLAGVQIRPAGYAEPWVRRHVFELKSTLKQEVLFYDFLELQLNKPYDSLAIVAFLTQRDWRDDSAWFCDELAARATERAGLCGVLYLPANKLTPTGWAVVVTALGGVDVT